MFYSVCLVKYNKAVAVISKILFRDMMLASVSFINVNQKNKWQIQSIQLKLS